MNLLQRPLGHKTVLSIVAALLGILVLQFAIASRANSVTWDEAHHLYDGYNIWKRFDYGLNPEVPPLVKMVAALPLLHLPLVVPPMQNRDSQTEAFLDGQDFLFHNDADKILFRSRMAVSIFTIILAVTVFAAAWEMFNPATALIAIALLVFDPNVLAHGALVTTDVPITACIFLALYLTWRYVRNPSLSKLAVFGLATGAAFATKFTGLLVLPMLGVLAIVELISLRDWRLFGKRVAAIFAVTTIAFAILWAFYGFRYSARPQNEQLHPPLATYLKAVPSPKDSSHLALIARSHALPEAYLYGLANTKITEFADTSYFFGRVYRHGNWFYFPVAFLIKSTLPFLLLLVATIVLIALRRFHNRREIILLLVPVAVYLAIAMHSDMNIGLRHLLPIYAFLYVIAGASAAILIRRNSRWAYAIAVLLVWQLVASVRIAPAYMAYANEAWGGPERVHLYLSDANSDWGQQLRATRRYLEAHNIHKCWFAYFVDGVVDPAFYGIPCKRLPTIVNNEWLNLSMDVPAEIDGPVLISDSILAGIDYGQGSINPYSQFRDIPPAASIQYGLFIYDGHFQVPLASALVHARHSLTLLAQQQPEQALAEANEAVALTPQSVPGQLALGDSLAALHRPDEARTHYSLALKYAQTIEPELQARSISAIQQKIQALH